MIVDGCWKIHPIKSIYQFETKNKDTISRREAQKIIKDSCNLLNENRFAVWVIGETRDNKGLIRGLVPETIAAFKEAGLSLYNNAITADPQASSALRAGPYFRTGRKLVTVHQHFLVFVKGDWRKAAEYCNSSDSEE